MYKLILFIVFLFYAKLCFAQVDGGIDIEQKKIKYDTIKIVDYLTN